MIDQPTSLYRFFGADDQLLYIGITNSLPRRLDRHNNDKPWFREAEQVIVEHYDDRASALLAEAIAIKAEQPRYNIKHNAAVTQRRSKAVKERATTRAPTRTATLPKWYFEHRRSGYARNIALWLYPELDGSSCIDDCPSEDGEDEFEFYLDYLDRHRPEWLERDAVPIYWSVNGDGTCETAPFQERWRDHEDFLSFFTWPEDQETEEPLDWFRLPVLNDRFPAFASVLAWTPSPFQPTCPLRSIVENRRGFYRHRTPPHYERGGR